MPRCRARMQDQHWPEPIEEERLLATAQHEPLRDHALHGAGASMTGGCSEWGTDGHGFSWMLDNSSQEQVDAFLASPWPQVPMPVHPAPNPLPSTPAAAAAAATPAVPPQWRPPHDIVQAVERAVAEIESGAWDDELFSIKATLPYDKPLQSPPRTSHDYDHSVHYMPCILDAKCNLHYADACHCNNGGCSCHTTVCLPDHRVEPTAYAQVCASHCSNNSNATTYAGHSDATTFAGHVRKGCDDDPGRQEVEPGLTWRRPPPAFFPTTPPAAPTTPTCAKGCCILSVPPAGSERFAAWRAGNGGTPFPLPHKNGAARAGPLIPNTASPPKPRTPSHVTVGAPAARSLSLAPKGIVRPASSGGGVAARPYLAGTTQVAPTLTAMRKVSRPLAAGNSRSRHRWANEQGCICLGKSLVTAWNQRFCGRDLARFGAACGWWLLAVTLLLIGMLPAPCPA